MGIVSYAQNFEDVMLWRALKSVKRGCYVDVGALHPIVDSVSKAFYENGWKGTHIEPTPQYSELLRKDRPDELVIQAALSNTRGAITLYEMHGLSTGDPEIADRHKKNGIEPHPIVVPCITLDDVLKNIKQKNIHWLKIDVEGMELQVLQGWKSKRRPWIVVVESTLPNSQVETWDKWEPELIRKDYHFTYFDGLNRYYLSKDHLELKQFFQSPPNVFDGFQLEGGASSSFCDHLNRRLEQSRSELMAQVTKVSSERDALRSDYNQLIHSPPSEKLVESLRASHVELKSSLEQLVQRERDFFNHTESLREESKKNINDQALKYQEQEGLLRKSLDELKDKLSSEGQLARDKLGKIESELLLEKQSNNLKLEGLARDLDNTSRENESERSNYKEAIAEQEEKYLVLKEKYTCEGESHLEEKKAIFEKVARLEERHIEELNHQREKGKKIVKIVKKESLRRELKLKSTLDKKNKKLVENKERWVEKESQFISRLQKNKSNEKKKIKEINLAHASDKKKSQVYVLALKNKLLNKDESISIKDSVFSNRVSSLEADKIYLKEEIEDLTCERKSLEESLQKLQIDILEAGEIELEMRKMVEVAMGEVKKLSSELSEVHKSLSWRCTRPLRMVYALFHHQSITSEGSENNHLKNDIANTNEKKSINVMSKMDENEHQISAPELSGDADLTEVIEMETRHSIVTLLNLHEGSFVEATYKLFLQRSSDPEGKEHYLNLLRSGVSKEFIISEIALSPEAQINKVDVPGVTSLIRDYKRSKSMIRGFFGKEKRIQKKLNVLEYRLVKQQQEVSLKMESIDSSIQELGDQIRSINSQLLSLPLDNTPPPSVHAQPFGKSSQIIDTFSFDPSLPPTEVFSELKSQLATSNEAKVLSRS